MAPPLPNSAHTETSSYLRNLAVPRGLNLKRAQPLQRTFRCVSGKPDRVPRRPVEKGGFGILPPTDLHKRLKTARYRGVHVRG